MLLMSQHQPSQSATAPAENSNRNDGDYRTNSNKVRSITTTSDKLNSKMEGNVFPDKEQLLGFLKKLKEVFDVCDEDADGYIRVEHFVDLGLQFGQGDRDEVKKLTKYLDPNAHGRINFKDFCYGVFAIKGARRDSNNNKMAALPTTFVMSRMGAGLTSSRCRVLGCRTKSKALTSPLLSQPLASSTPTLPPVASGRGKKEERERGREGERESGRKGERTGCEEILKTALGPRSVPIQTDNGYIYQNGEARLGPPIIMCTRPYPDCSVEQGECCDMDSTNESGVGSDTSDGGRRNEKEEGLGGLFNNSGQLIGSASASIFLGEEQFEDYGEGEDVDYTPSSPCPDDDARTNGFSDLGSSLPSSAGQTPLKMCHLYNSDVLDVYCSQCYKKVNLLNDLEARLNNLRANSPNRKISSTAFGRQLFQHNHSAFSSSQGSTEDLFRDSIDSCDVDITEKVSYLEKKVTELENDSLANGDLKSKLKQGNTQLVHRVHELEEQLKDQESRAEQTLEEETHRHRETYCKMERDKNTDLELLSNRVQQLEEENGEMKLNVCKLKSQTEKLDQEKQRMTDRLEDTSLRLKDEMDLYRKMMDKLWQNRHEFQKEREAMQELIEDLRRELEHLQLFKLGSEAGRGAGLSEYNAKTREIEMEHEVKRLKQENFKLRDQNDDLNSQILSLSLYEAKNLFACHTKVQSLAAEIDNASRDELVDALKEQECVNFRLRQYMDKIILAILDHNPSILEIKRNS